MSIASEIMEEHYDEIIQNFLKKLEEMFLKNPSKSLEKVIIEYKKHFKNNGIYGK